MKIKLKNKGKEQEYSIDWLNATKLYLFGYSGLLAAITVIFGALFWLFIILD